MKAFVTRKIGMTSIVSEDGSVIAVTLLSATPNTVTQVKTVETDGYNAVQVGAETRNRIGKTMAGHLKAAGASSSTKPWRLKSPRVSMKATASASQAKAKPVSMAVRRATSTW